MNLKENRILRFAYTVFIAICLSIIGGYFLNEAAFAETAQNIPWSGYWWPMNYGGLATGADYRGHPAPLEKYSMLISGSSGGPVVDWYLANDYDPNAKPWMGLCPLWARSSILETYSILPSSIDNIVFRVGDKKGLLALLHDGGDFRVEDGSDPVNLHFWLLNYIKDQKKSFTADLSPGEEVWYYPIYQYEMNSVKQGANEYVTVDVYYASDQVEPDFIGTKTNMITYTYTLFLNAAGDITGGKYTGYSVDMHPDMLSYPISTKPQNPYLNADTVRVIAKSTGSDLRKTGDNSPVLLQPGTYHLVLANEDTYTLEGQPGDEMYIVLDKEEGSAEPMNAAISDNSGKIVFQQKITSSGSIADDLLMDSSPYTLTLTQNNYGSDPNIYSLSIDQKEAYRQNIPYIPVNGMWSGFTITNSSAEVVKDLRLFTRSKDGMPLQTLLGPVQLNPGEKRMFLFETLPFRKHEYSSIDSATLISNQPVDMINLFAFPGKAMAGFVQKNSAGTHLVIPDIFNPPVFGASQRSMTGAVVNESFVEAPIVCRLYSSDGKLQSEINDIIPPSGKFSIEPGQEPFTNVPNDGWIDVVSTQGVKISGYQYVREHTANSDAMDTLFAIPYNSAASSKKIVPHITDAFPCLWTTSLTLINPNNEGNSVNLHLARAGNDHHEDMNIEMQPYEKKKINLTEAFGKSPGEYLYHSILEIQGEHPIIGTYAYSYSYGDIAAYPLIGSDEFKNELVLPHCPSINEWWTGVHIANPNDFSVTVAIEPYDAKGNLLDNLTGTILLEPGAYEAFTVLDFVKNSKSASMDISYIKIHSTEPGNAPLCGAYIYGNIINGNGRMDSLSGANM